MPSLLPPAIRLPASCLFTSLLYPSAGVAAPSTVPIAASTSTTTPISGGLPSLSSLHGTMIDSLTGPGFTNLLTFLSTAASTSFLTSTTLASVQLNSRCSFLLPAAHCPHRAHFDSTPFSASVSLVALFTCTSSVSHIENIILTAAILWCIALLVIFQPASTSSPSHLSASSPHPLVSLKYLINLSVFILSLSSFLSIPTISTPS